MAKIGNRVKETTATTGTGTIDLNGAAVGFNAFMDEFTTGDPVYYLIVDDPANPTEFEYGVGTITAGTPDTLSRDTVEGSSNSGSKVSFQAGTKTVISTITAAAFGIEGPLSGWARKTPDPVSQTTNFSVTSSHDGRLIVADGSGNSPAGLTATLPTLTAADAGFTFWIVNQGASGAVTVTDANSPVRQINGANSLTVSVDYGWAMIWWTGTAWRALSKPADAPAASLPRGYLSGMILSNNSSDSDHDIDITAGECRGADDDEDISIAAQTRAIDQSFTTGGPGGLAGNLTVANTTWYHVFAVSVGGTMAVGFDTSITAANLVSQHAVTAYRRIGSVRTDGSANILAFTQFGDEIFWQDPPLDIDKSLTTSASSETLTVPTGVSVRALLNFRNTDGDNIYVSPINTSDEAPSTTAAPLSSLGTGAAVAAGQVQVWTNTSAQVRMRAGSTNAVRAALLGWRDLLGR